ncbi:hypothetical protein Sjap_001301 [Stephania japonica]|uniref:Exostosin GT47 domain-containing protein n=1 Tax=Stephania japonica TaxID=461633 RepID=A0AAP0PUW9_9MAGN
MAKSSKVRQLILSSSSTCCASSAAQCLSIALSVGLLSLILLFELATHSNSTANLTRISSSSDFNASYTSSSISVSSATINGSITVKGDDYNVNVSTILEIMRDHYDLDYDDEMDNFHYLQVDRKGLNNSSLHVEHQIIKYDESVNKSTNGSSGPRKEYTKLDRIELGLTQTRAVIGKAARHRTHMPDPDYTPQGPIYWNAAAFQRSYLEMEKSFKVFVYEEGEPPLFHTSHCKSIYAIEGIFFSLMETGNKFRTKNHDEAHAFFLPFSIAMMVRYIFDEKVRDSSPFDRTINDYINLVGERYPYWNRSEGADHFMVSCHDWGPHESKFNSFLFKNSIRVLCNANTSEGFRPEKDVTLPEILLHTGKMGPIGGPSPRHRPILAFFAGGLHGPIRPILLKHWKDKDKDMQVYEYLPKDKSYDEMMKKSKFCLCPSGYEVASPRVAEALYIGCVPVLISEGYVPPFSDVLNWNAFSIIVPPSDIPNLKNILMSISQRRYLSFQKRGQQVRTHFIVNSPPKRYDVFHMLLHSVWLRRLNVRIRSH